MKIRYKILSGFVILATMLLIAGVISIIELTVISRSVNTLVADNYKSIEAAKIIDRAIQKQNIGALLLVRGKQAEGQKMIIMADSLFNTGNELMHSITLLPDEEPLLDSIKTQHVYFQGLWTRVFDKNTPTQVFTIEWYYGQVFQPAMETQMLIGRVVDINQRMMYKSAAAIETNARRTIMPTIVAIISAVIFTLIFNYFINVYFVSPIVKITKGLENSAQFFTPFNVDIDTKDELFDLKQAIMHFIASYKTKI